MLVKWIVCEVARERRRDFDGAQRAWAALAEAPGFLGQLGGWEREGGEACILGLWRDLEAYQRFMSERHDALAEAGEGTYTGIRTALFSAPDKDREGLMTAEGELWLIEGAMGPGRWPGLNAADRGLGIGKEGEGRGFCMVLVEGWRVRPRG